VINANWEIKFQVEIFMFDNKEVNLD